MKTGAQLYTIRTYTQNEKDFARSMKRIAQIGYKTVQISAVGKDIRCCALPPDYRRPPGAHPGNLR